MKEDQNMDYKGRKLQEFDLDGVGLDNGNLFGFPLSAEESDLILLPVPWDLTASYGKGTAHGPQAILKASPQLDFYDRDYPDTWKKGMFLLEESQQWKRWNTSWADEVSRYVAFLEQGGTCSAHPEMEQLRQQINAVCAQLHSEVKDACLRWLKQGKKVGLVGGEHSIALGLIQAMAEMHDAFGILQLDAHADLRNAYEGLTFSHASVFHEVLKLPQVKRLTQVGVRDLCMEERNVIDAEERISCFFDRELKESMFQGVSWDQWCDDIVQTLPEKVYISFDIDALEPQYCPNTGTPVPGGLSTDHVDYLLRKVIKSGKEIVGFDLSEVTPGHNEWDANVGARMLYKLGLFTLQ